ncbi:LrgB family protein [Intestinibacillus massiliensis]|uniref:LrgB family protein n=1 Tax=Intestinibacillus massiliensis TaxID=1871029 RepID=UPI000B3566DC|nr:LrgB family protein [Intestinibacillus massiliensis]
MKDVLTSPLAWLALSVLSYEIGLLANRRLKTPVANPLLIAMVLMCALLVATGTSTETYNTGGAFISMFLTPATVALAIPIYRQLGTLKKHLLPILLGAFVGSLASMGSVFVLCKLFGLDSSVIASLLPKSVTTPIGVEVARSLGGVPSITAIAIIVTGLFGAVCLPGFLKKLGVNHPVTTGIAIGTSSHAVGTSRAIELGETEGAMSGLAIGVAGLITALVASVVAIFL